MGCGFRVAQPMTASGLDEPKALGDFTVVWGGGRETGQGGDRVRLGVLSRRPGTGEWANSKSSLHGSVSL